MDNANSTKKFFKTVFLPPAPRFFDSRPDLDQIGTLTDPNNNPPSAENLAEVQAGISSIFEEALTDTAKYVDPATYDASANR
jgi:hypothetical protein